MAVSYRARKGAAFRLAKVLGHDMDPANMLSEAECTLYGGRWYCRLCEAKLRIPREAAPPLNALLVFGRAITCGCAEERGLTEEALAERAAREKGGK